MREPEKSVAGFFVARRCDQCGTRVDLEQDTGEQCTLRCSRCGKKYEFYLHTEVSLPLQLGFVGRLS